MSEAPEVLDEATVARIETAIASAEEKTSAEIVAVLARRSSIYWHAPYQAGLTGSIAAIVVATVATLIATSTWPVWHVGWFVLIAGAGLAGGFVLARLEGVERRFAGEAVMAAECREQAARLFTEHAVFGTRARTGVLLYVSLFEHVVIVLDDETVASRVRDEEWRPAISAMVTRLRAREIEGAFHDGLREVGGILAERLPREAGDRDELPSRLYLV